MQQYRATVSFAGEVSMYAGEVREVEEIKAAPLIECGYLEPVKNTTTAKRKDK